MRRRMQCAPDARLPIADRSDRDRTEGWERSTTVAAGLERQHLSAGTDHRALLSPIRGAKHVRADQVGAVPTVIKNGDDGLCCVSIASVRRARRNVPALGLRVPPLLGAIGREELTP